MTHGGNIAQEAGRGRPRPAVFLDRDGTINVDLGYVSAVAQWAFTTGTEAALRSLKRAGFLLLVVTNQSGLARGYFDEAQLARLHEHAQALLRAEDAAVDAFYVSPFHPDHGRPRYDALADTRKPELGLFRAACADHAIDIARSWMIGDKPSDVEFGLRAGLRAILIGREPPPDAPVATVGNLAEAAAFILSQLGPAEPPVVP